MALPHLLVFLSFLSSGLACIPTVTPDDMYEEEMSTTSVLMTMTQTQTSTMSTTTATSSTTTTSFTYMCPNGMWVLNDMTGRCYLLRVTPLNWEDAENDCITNFGSHLVSIGDQAENDYIYDTVVLPTMPAFTGLIIGLRQLANSNALSGVSMWEDGTPYDYSAWTNWFTVPPAQSINPRCIFMAIDDSDPARVKKWVTAGSCTSNAEAYMCETAATII